MLALELCCVVIVVLYLVVRAQHDPDSKRFLARLGLLMVGSWIGENSVIHAYHFYYYSTEWSLFVDQVPILIVTIWPVVIHSAWDLANHLTTPTRAPLLGACFVLADAWLIEPIAVSSGLWTWTQPGLFAVPPIGVIGWAYFAGCCMAVFQRGKLLPVLIVAPIGVHLMLLASWWGGLRWISVAVPTWPAVVIAWTLSLSLMIVVLKRRASQHVPIHEMLLRVPAAGFFFVLLALDNPGYVELIVWALAFAPPYLALTPWDQLKRSPAAA